MAYSKGVCIWFTGRSGVGKSTTTKALLPLFEQCQRTVTVLDVVPLLAKCWCERTSEGKLMRKGFVAKEVVRHGGVAICVTISARHEIREAVRQLVGPDNFIEVFVDAPLEVSAERKASRKNKPRPLLKRIKFSVRRSLKYVPFRKQRTYDRPLSSDLTIDSTVLSPEECAQTIFQLLIDRGFVDLEKGQRSLLTKDEMVGTKRVDGKVIRAAADSIASETLSQNKVG